MLTPDKITQLEELAYGRLSPEDRAGCEAQLANDPEFAAEAQAYLDLFDGFQSLEVEAFEAQLQDWEKAYTARPELQLVEPERPRGLVFKMADWVKRHRLAASIALMLLPAGYVATNWLLARPVSVQELLADEWQAPDVKGELYLYGIRGGSPTPQPNETTVLPARLDQQLLEKGVAAYNLRQFDQAIVQFDAYLLMPNAPTKTCTEVQFYLGVSHLMLNRPESAQPIFEQIIQKKKDNTLQDEAEWYLALTLLKAKKFGEADALLKKIAKSPKSDKATPHPYQAKAAAMLQRMRGGVQ